MAKKDRAAGESLRTYPIPLKGDLLLVCGKCQRKLKHDHSGLSSLKKLLKQQAKRDPAFPRLHLLRVPCLKMCPKAGVTVATAHQVARHQCSILYTPEDFIQLLAPAPPQ